jgi:sulfite reductase alpha subunit-like flavoprotein
MSSFSLDFSVGTGTITLILGLVVFALVRYFVRRQVKSVLERPADQTSEVVKTEEKTAKAEKAAEACCNKTDCCQSGDNNSCEQKQSGPLVILYGTTTGTARQFSGQLAARLQKEGLATAVTLRNCADFGKNVDEEFAAFAKNRTRLVNKRKLS